MITKISSHKNGQVVYYFNNGVILSFIWDWGTYSDNRDEEIDLNNIDREYSRYYGTTTVEIMSVGDNTNGIDEYLEEKYGGNPAGYVPVKDIHRILERADYGELNETEEYLVKALSDNNLAIEYDGKEILITPTCIRLKQIVINTKKVGYYKVDPELVPDKLKEDNIFWKYEPMECYGIEESGEQIPIYVSDGVQHNSEIIHPYDK